MQRPSTRFVPLTALALISGACGGETRPLPCGGTLEEHCRNGRCPEDLATAIAWSIEECDDLRIPHLIPAGDRRAVSGAVDALIYFHFEGDDLVGYEHIADAAGYEHAHCHRRFVWGRTVVDTYDTECNEESCFSAELCTLCPSPEPTGFECTPEERGER